MADESVDVVLAGVSKPFRANKSADGRYRFYHRIEVLPDDFTLLTDAAVTGGWVDWPGGPGLWSAWGVFNGATVKLQYSPDDGTTAIDLPMMLADKGALPIALPADKLRVSIATPGGSTSISSKIKRTG